MKAGYAEVDITPPDNSPMSAFPRGSEKQPRIAAGAHDRLKARVIILSNAVNTVAIVSSDLLAWSTSDALGIKQKTEELAKGKIQAQNIMLSCTHTHSSLENTYLFGAKAGDPLIARLKEKVTEIICKALDNLVDAELFFAQTSAPFNHNRRVIKNKKSLPQLAFNRNAETTGITDPVLSLLRFELKNGKTLFWLNWTAHALTLGPKNNFFTADYPGELARLLEEEFPGSRAMFTNGCAGNIHPYKSMQTEYSAMQEVANNLKEKAVLANNQATRIAGEKLHLAYLELPLAHRTSENITIKIPMACLTLANLKIGFLPGEPFVEFQLRYREEMKPAYSFLNGYSNGWSGYIPTAEAFTEGGYGVDLFIGDPAPELDRTQICQGAGEIIMDNLIELSQPQ